jgi:hypothetical protein
MDSGATETTGMDVHQGSVIGLFVIAIAVSACSLALDADREQCVTDADCAGLAELSEGVCVDSLCRARPEPGWACLDPAVSALRPSVPAEVRVLIPFTELLTAEAAPGVNLRACDREDTQCQRPLATATADPSGSAIVDLPGGFDGYFQWESANVAPAMYFLGVPLVRDTVFPIIVVARQAYEALIAQFDDIIVEGRSDVLLTVLDCDGTPAIGAGLTVPEADSAVQIFYIADGLFAPNLTATGAGGLARVFNIPPGQGSITAWLPDGREIGTVRLFTRPGVSALANVGPPPFR